jgi:hypothetical protein
MVFLQGYGQCLPGFGVKSVQRGILATHLPWDEHTAPPIMASSFPLQPSPLGRQTPGADPIGFGLSLCHCGKGRLQVLTTLLLSQPVTVVCPQCWDLDHCPK